MGQSRALSSYRVDCGLGACKELRRPLLNKRVLHLAQHSAVDWLWTKCAGLQWAVRAALHWNVLMGEQRGGGGEAGWQRHGAQVMITPWPTQSLDGRKNCFLVQNSLQVGSESSDHRLAENRQSDRRALLEHVLEGDRLPWQGLWVG